MEFEVKKFDAGGRLGLISHNGKKLITPNLFPVVSPFSNLISPKEIYETFGGSAVFTNAYILYNNKEKAQEAIEKGIHNFLDYPGLIATDSGAFQHYMYGGEDDINAEDIERFQEQIGSDFPVILDVPVQLEDPRDIAETKIEKTVLRAKENLKRRSSEKSAWFGPIHGGKYLDLVKKSSLEMNKLNFGIFAIGGVVKTFNDYMFDLSMNVLLTARRFLNPSTPLHMFGLGLPQFFSLAVACGADLMDSAAYILFAKEGRYFTLQGTTNIGELTEFPCNCPICSHYSVKEVRDSFTRLHKQKNKNKKKKDLENNVDSELNGIELLARHNLYVSFGELKTIREAIRTGTLWDLVEQRIHAHPRLIKAYQEIPKYWPQLESMELVEKSKATFFLGEISNSRPIIYRVINKVYYNYSIPGKRRLILIPELDASIFNSPVMKEWIKEIDFMNTEIVKEGRFGDLYEVIIISDIFGPIPYKLIDVYPNVQREWTYSYHRSENEFRSLLNYQNLSADEILPNNFHKNSLPENFTDLFREVIINDVTKKDAAKEDIAKEDIVKDEIEDKIKNGTISAERLFKLDDFIKHDDIINRIEICISFLKKHSEKIADITILRPKTFETVEGYQVQLKTHLIDDISQILDKNKEILGREIKIKRISSL